MKIAYINPTVLMRRSIAELARAMARLGHDVTIISPREPRRSPFIRRADDQLNHPNIKLVSIWSWELQSLLWSIPTDRQLTRKLREIITTHDILHLWAPYYILPLWAITQLARTPSPRSQLILTFDTIPGRSFSMGWGWDQAFHIYHRTVAKQWVKTADKLTFYGPSLKSAAAAASLWDEKKVTILPIGLDLARVQKNVPALCSADLNLPAHLPIVLYVGLLNRRKGFDTFLRIAAKVPKAHFVVVGSSHNSRRWEQFIRRLNSTERVTLIGHRSDVERFYDLASVVVVPSRGEGLPGVVMEAMARGRPVIASQIPCLPDLITAGVTGYLCPSEDIDCFARRVQQIITDPKLGQLLGKAGQQKINQFDWQVIAPRYQALYESVAL